MHIILWWPHTYAHCMIPCTYHTIQYFFFIMLSWCTVTKYSMHTVPALFRVNFSTVCIMLGSQRRVRSDGIFNIGSYQYADTNRTAAVNPAKVSVRISKSADDFIWVLYVVKLKRIVKKFTLNRLQYIFNIFLEES